MTICKCLQSAATYVANICMVKDTFMCCKLQGVALHSWCSQIYHL